MKLASTLISILLLAGCSAPAAPVATPSASVSTPAATPTPAAATPQQFASVIAGQESDWRQVIEGAADCRYLWVVGTSGAHEKTEAMTCYVREATIVISTKTAARKLRALSPSSDMEELVGDTLDALDAISAVDIESVCGEAWHGPKDTKACTLALGDLFSGYYTLGKVLDKWKPYT